MFIKVDNLAGHLDEMSGWVEARDAANSAHAFARGAPKILPAQTIWADGSNTSYDNASWHVVVSVNEPTPFA
jgi:hypothetical protein